ncbi:MAG: uracil-DNA glycosylase [Kiritimatiellae bacterium]|nr:uracil-DNA glycosylase [Kiritimatiellia bacterium]
MENLLEESWREVLADEFKKPYFAKLKSFISEAYEKTMVFPPREKIFAAFSHTPFSKVKAVIIGQDPYHEPGEAQGLSFYVPPETKTPPSLRNIAKELGKMPNLLSWTNQGVLLLNATLTVEAHKAASHQKQGWETFTDAAVRALAEKRSNLVFILWGAYAQKKGAFINRTRHCIIESAHPSPLSASRGFFGSKPFEKANAYLEAHSISKINW